MPKTLPRFLWHYSKRYPFSLIGLIAVAIVWAAYISVSPYAMKLIIDAVSDAGDDAHLLFEKIYLPALLYVGSALVLSLAFRFYDWVVMYIYPAMRQEITQEMFDYVEGHSYNYFQSNLSGSVANKINDMARSSVTVISNLIDNFFARGLSVIVGTLTMYLVHPSFAAVVLIWGVIFMVGAIVLSKRSLKYSSDYSDARSLAVGKIVDSLSNILNVKLFAREGYESRYLQNYLGDAATKDRQLHWYLLKVKAFYAFSITILIAVMTWLLIIARSKGQVTIGDFALILTLTMWILDEFFFIANQLAVFSEELGICQQALTVISHTHELMDTPNAAELKVTKGEIDFDRVNFQYKKGKNIFCDKSITIHSGQKVGLVGFSGSGKSTFVNLILRFFDVTSGQILIDGQDIKNVTQSSLRSQIALIPQDPVLFHRSLIENIRYGRLDASDEEVIASSKKAHCHEFATKLQGGYQSQVGERGARLSGGQRQRIAIARAILKNAPILILDEATSALDSVTEKYIQESLAGLMKGRTTIVVAHRLSTLFNMDRILVFSDGRVVEDGTHQELIKLNGHYAKLWKMQAGGFIGEYQYPIQKVRKWPSPEIVSK